MNASFNSKKQCVTCNKSGGILTCDGCQQSFCGKHVAEHRQDLSAQLDIIMQEHDLLQQELLQPSVKKTSLLKKIDKWEKDSITMIQGTAETARVILQELLEQSQERLTNRFPDIAEGLRSSREADDFSERDLDQWRNQLKEFEFEMKSTVIPKLVHDKTAPIYLIALKSNESAINQSISRREPTRTAASSSTFDLQEGFHQALGPVNIEEDGYLATHIGPTAKYAYVCGRSLYSTGCHTIRFRVEKCQKYYHTFFGCMSSNLALTEDVFRSESSVGWFGFNQVYEQGLCSSNCKKHGYNSSKILTNDVLHITFDCDGKQIRLFNERLKTENTIKVNIDKTPYPWQLLIVMFHKNDCVRMLADM